MSEWWWYVGRASGVVAAVLVVAALVVGLRVKARANGGRRRPNWWLDLHNFLGGSALAFTAVHVVAVYQDDLSGIGLAQVLVPFTAAGWRWGITFGVVAGYVLALVVLTSWPVRRASRRMWLMIHVMSVPAAVMVGIHAWMVGSSRDQWWFRALVLTLAAPVVYAMVLRLWSLVVGRRRRRDRSSAGPPVSRTTGAEDAERQPLVLAAAADRP